MIDSDNRLRDSPSRSLRGCDGGHIIPVRGASIIGADDPGVAVRVVSESGKYALTEAIMRMLKFGTNFAVFLLFFGVATLEAVQTQNWLKVVFWLAIGIAFLAADNLRKTHLRD